MSSAYDIGRDLREAEAMLDGLPAYLRGGALYGSAGGGFFNFQGMPALTVGALELRLRRLALLLQDDDRRAQVATMARRRDEVREEWRAHYGRKLRRELRSRLDLARHFLAEAAENPHQAARDWAPEQLRRSIAEECRGALSGLGGVEEELEALRRRGDAGLAALATERAAFPWDARLAPVYPAAQFWWLRRRPPA